MLMTFSIDKKEHFLFFGLGGKTKKELKWIVSVNWSAKRGMSDLQRYP